MEFSFILKYIIQQKDLKILKNFVVDICGCRQNWTPESFIAETISNLKNTLGNDKVVLGLSGGVDSSVAAVLLHQGHWKKPYLYFCR